MIFQTLPALLLSTLLIAEGAWAQQSQGGARSIYRQPSCAKNGTLAGQTAAAMKGAAEGAVQRDATVFQNTALDTAKGVDQGVKCVTEVTKQINENIPSFGGGAVGSFINNLINKIATDSCQMIKRQVDTTLANVNTSLPNVPGLVGNGTNIDFSRMGLGEGAGAAPQSINVSPPNVFDSSIRALSNIF